MRDLELRRWVERMLSGEFQPAGLDRLLPNLRFKTHGAPSMVEIGHFLAHNDTRDKGPITDEARDFFAVMQLQIPRIGQALDLSNVPAPFCRAVRSTFRKLDPIVLQRETGLKKKIAKRVLETALGKFSVRPDGRLRLADTLSSDEGVLVQACTRRIIVRQAFTDDDLFRDFCLMLEKNNLLKPGEVSGLSGIKAGLTLYAVARLHLTELQLDGGARATLRGGVDGEGSINLSADAEVTANDGRLVGVLSPMITTQLKAAEWCDAGLFNSPPQNCHWRCPVEITPEPRIKPL
jgi:hypothetical protein